MSTTRRLPSPQEMIARAAALAPILRERSAASEQARACPAETVRAFHDADLHRLVQPARYGGYAMGWDTLCEVALALARGCPAQGWVLTIYGDHAQQLGMFDRRAQDDVWGANARALVSSSFFGSTGTARRVAGGAALTGKWGFLSGIDHASWVMVGNALDDGTGRPEYQFFLVPKSAGAIVDDWHVFGLSGTGSKSFALADVFVPDHRRMRMTEALDGTAIDADAAPIHRMPRRTAGLGLAAIGVGAARAMLDEFIAAARQRVSRAGPVAHDQWVQLQTAEAAAALAAAELLLVAAARRTMEILGRGESLGVEQRTTNKRDSGYAAKLARDSADRLFAIAGGNSLFLTNAVQRLYRDMHAATAHAALRWEIAATPFGRAALGAPPVEGTY